MNRILNFLILHSKRFYPPVHIMAPASDLAKLASDHSGLQRIRNPLARVCILLTLITNVFSLQLSESEQAWIRANPQIVVAPDPLFHPVEFFDKNGEYRGISRDYLDLITQTTGLKFRFARLQNRQEILSALSLGQAAHEWFLLHFPDLALIEVSSVKDGLEKLAFEEIDCFVENIAPASFQMQEFAISNLKISGDLPFSYRLSLAIRKDWKELQSILNKALLSISKEKKKEIYERWISRETENSPANIPIFIPHSERFYLSVHTTAPESSLSGPTSGGSGLQGTGKPLAKWYIFFGLSFALMILFLIFKIWTLNKKILHHTLDLEKIKKEAILQSRAKSDFVAHTSHEIRTPLNGMIGFLELLKDTNLNSKQGEYVDIIHRSAQNLLQIVNEILDFSKIEEGKLPIEICSFHLHELLEDTLLPFTKLAMDKGLILFLSYAPNQSDSILCDPIRLRQAITNLVGNAIKFTDRGFVHVDAEFLDNKIRICVKDTGIGIPQEKQKVIFEAFSQADVSISRQYGGTGLGLNISKRILDALGGEISIASEPGKGSTFFIELPLKSADTKPITYHNPYRFSLELPSYLQIPVKEILQKAGILHQPSKEEPAQVFFIREKKNKISVESPGNDYLHSTNLLSPKILNFSREKKKAEPKNAKEVHKFGGRVLIAEDNFVNQEVAKGILKRFGFEILVAQNGKEAVELCLQNSFCLIFMDCSMPEMDGFEATKEIRKQSNFTKIPIIAFTAHAFSDIREKCQACGMDEYLSKPIQIRDLQEILKRRLEISPSLPEQKENRNNHSKEIVEWDYLFNATEGDCGFMETLLNRFFGDCRTHLRELLSLRFKNIDLAFNLAHRLKGMCANLGIHQGAKICSQIEKDLKGGNTEILPLTEALFTLFDRLEENYNQGEFHKQMEKRKEAEAENL